MPKVTSFNPDFGYIRHPNDVDHTCFWCGVPVANTWDYTPNRQITRHTELHVNLQKPFYAVQSCSSCINKMAYRKLMLLTIESKLLYFKLAKEKAIISLDRAVNIIKSNCKSWQAVLEDGSITDVPNEFLSEYQIEAKRLHNIAIEEGLITAPQKGNSLESGANLHENSASGDVQSAKSTVSTDQDQETDANGNTLYKF